MQVAIHLWQGSMFVIGEHRDVTKSARRADELSISSLLKETLREAELSGCAFHKSIRVALVDPNVRDSNRIGIPAGLLFGNDGFIYVLSPWYACL